MNDFDHKTGVGRLLVFGGTGFLGSAVVRHARDRGVPVASVARGNRRNADGLYPDIVCDITDAGMLKHVIASGDTVLNLVGLSPVSRPRGGRRTYHEHHVIGTRNLVRAADNAGAARFVYVSALGVHRRCGAAYGETKAQAEAVVHAGRTPGIILAPSLLFGAESEVVRSLNVIAKLSFLPFVPVPAVNAVFRPIHVDDAARHIVAVALASSAASSTSGPTPLVGPERLTGYAIASCVLGAHGINVVRVPGWITGPIVALVSVLKLPGLPAELRQMLRIDNAGPAPENTSGLVRFSHWVRNTSRPARPVIPATLGDSTTD